MRNSRREGAARVPDKAILGTYKRLRVPARAEGFDALYYVLIDKAAEFTVEEWQDEV